MTRYAAAAATASSTPPALLPTSAADPIAASRGIPPDLGRSLRHAVQGDAFWEPYLTDQDAAYAVHLAVCAEPFLRYLLEGRKRVDSRFSTRRSAPYARVPCGDIVLVKRAAGPVVGLCRVTDAWFYRLDPR